MPGSAGNPVGLEHEPAAGALSDARGVAGDAVREVDHGVSDAGESAALLEPKRRPAVALDQLVEPGEALAERVEARGRAAERAGDDEHVARAGAGASGHALAPPHGGHREDELLGARRVAAGDGDAGLVQALVELDDHRRPRPPGAERDATSSASGSAPMAARSLRLTAAAL